MKFFFEQNDVTTMDDRVSVFFSSDGAITALAKVDMLRFDGRYLSARNDEVLNACYSLVENWIPFEDIEVTYDLCIEELGVIDLISLKHGGYVRLLPNAIHVHLVTEGGEFTAEMAGSWDLLGPRIIRMERAGDVLSFEVGNTSMRVDIPDNCREGLQIRGLLGAVEATVQIGAIFITSIKDIPQEQRIGQTHTTA